jgi:biopolymer transport protein ExbB
MDLCNANSSAPFARIAKAGLLQYGESPEMIRFMVAERGGQEAASLERYQRVIGTVAYIAPLLGLLGTVSGMIKAFDVISTHSVGDPAHLAGGISEALITTAAGLLVAIPVVIMHKIIQSRASKLSLELDEEAVTLTEHLIKSSQKAESQSRAAC